MTKLLLSRVLIFFFGIHFAVIFSLLSANEGIPREIGLRHSLKIASESNLDIRLAIARKYISDFSINLSYSRLYPNISLISSYSRSAFKSSGTINIEGVEFEVSDKSTSDNYSYGISLSQWLFLPQNYLDIRNIADADRRISILSLLEQLQGIYYNITSKYFSYLKLLSLYELALEDLQTSRDHYNKTLNMYDIGLIDRLALSNAELAMHNKEFSLIKAENDLSMARIEYLNILGLPIDSDIKIIDDNIRFSADVLDVDLNYDFALNNNFSLQHRKEVVKKSQHNYRRSVNENLPSLSFSTSFNYSDNEFPTNDYRFSGTFSINFNLFRGFQDKYNMSMSRLRIKEGEYEVNKSEQEILLNLRKSISGIQVALSLLELSTLREEKAKSDIDLAEARYSSGLAIYLEVEDAKISYIRAKSDRISSYYDHVMANISLLMNRGDFLSTVENKIKMLDD